MLYRGRAVGVTQTRPVPGKYLTREGIKCHTGEGSKCNMGEGIKYSKEEASK